MKNISDTMPPTLTAQNVERLYNEGKIKGKGGEIVGLKYIEFSDDSKAFALIDNHLYYRNKESEEYELLNKEFQEN